MKKNILAVQLPALLSILVLIGGLRSASAGITQNKIDFQNIDQMIVFGDSLSDLGNTGTVNSALTNYFGLGGVWPAIPGWPAPFQDTNQFSNGNMWEQYLSASIHDTINPNFSVVTSASRALPYNPYEGFAVDITNSYESSPPTNASQVWAWGGAQTSISRFVGTNDPITIGYTLPSVSEEINQFTNAGYQFHSNTATFVWAGANDYFFYADSHSTNTGVHNQINGTNVVPPANYGYIAASNQLANIQRLINLGATNIVLMNLPDLGQTPGAMNGMFTNISQNLTPTQYSIEFNTGLSNGISSLTNNANVKLVDIYSEFQDMLANPSAYGLNSNYITQSAVIDYDPAVPSTFNTNVTTNQITNNDFSGWLFWDAVHPTQQGHQILANTIFQAAAVPEPSTYALVVLSVVAGLLAYRRKV